MKGRPKLDLTEDERLARRRATYKKSSKAYREKNASSTIRVCINDENLKKRFEKFISKSDSVTNIEAFSQALDSYLTERGF